MPNAAALYRSNRFASRGTLFDCGTHFRVMENGREQGKHFYYCRMCERVRNQRNWWYWSFAVLCSWLAGSLSQASRVSGSTLLLLPSSFILFLFCRPRLSRLNLTHSFSLILPSHFVFSLFLWRAVRQFGWHPSTTISRRAETLALSFWIFIAFHPPPSPPSPFLCLFLRFS